MNVKVSGVALQQQSLEDTPASVNVFDKRTIHALGVNSLIELVRFVPGFESYRTDGGNFDVIAVRGRVSDTSSREILLLVDGVRTDLAWEGSSTSYFSHISLEGVERVEFIRGAVSHVYGANAFLGAINIVTANKGGEISFRSGNRIKYKAGGIKDFKIGSTEQVVIFDAHKDRGEAYTVKDPLNGQPLDISDPSQSYYGKYKLTIDNWQADLSYRNSHSNRFFSVDAADQEFSNQDFWLGLATVKYKKVWQSGDSSHLQVGYKEFNRYAETAVLDFGQLEPLSEPASNDRLYAIADIDGKEYWLNWRGQKRLFEQLNIQAGYEYRHSDIEDVLLESNFDVVQLFNFDFPIAYYGTVSNRTLSSDNEIDQIHSIFALANYSFSNIDTSIGLRYDDSKLSGNNWSPRASIIYKLNKRNSLKAIYGEAFRPATNVELFTINNPVVTGNPELEAESVTTSELIWVRKTKKFRSQWTLFNSEFDNTIAVDFRLINSRYINTGRDSASGSEFSMEYDLGYNINILTNFTHLFEVPDNMFRNARNYGNFLVNYKLNQWNYSIDLNYVGDRYYLARDEVTRTPLESHTLVNSYVSYNFRQKYEINLQIKNLFDIDYATTNNGTSREPIPGRGIEASLGISLSF